MQAGIQGLNRIACGDAVNGFDAARRAAAGYLSLLVQRKVTQRKHAPEPPKPPALLAPAGREPNSPSANNAPGSDTGSRTPRPRLRCSAAATGLDVKSNTSNRKAKYSLRRVS